MKRFLSTTAVLLTLSGGAYADAHSAGFGDVTVQEGDFFATDLIGMRIYNSEVEVDPAARVPDGAELEWDDIGEINDVIIGQDGKVTAVILGIGGFLGLGERDVSVSMDSIKVVMEDGDSNDRFLVVTTSQEMLENAPEFDRGMGSDMEAANTTAVTETATTEPAAETATTDMATDSAMERPMLMRPAYEREGYAEADMEMVEALTAEDIQGSYVYGANDETVGEVDSLVMGDDGKVSQVVINVGGFLGLGEKPVAVTFDELQILKNVDGDDFRIYIDSTKEALEAQPDYEG